MQGLPDKEVQCSINTIIREQVFLLVKERGSIKNPQRSYQIHYKQNQQQEKSLKIVIICNVFDNNASEYIRIEKPIKVDLYQGKVQVFKAVQKKERIHGEEAETEKSVESTNNGIVELTNRVEKLEHIIEKLIQNNTGITVNINKLDVQNFVLEKLSYQLGDLEIKEISGALNIGNNLGVSVQKKKEEETERLGM